MKACAYCGRENDAVVAACIECGTELVPLEAPPLPLRLTPRGRMVLWTCAFVVAGLAIAAMPVLVLIIPLMLIFYLPLYLPLLLSFLLKAQEWAGLRWSLRIASAAALYMWLSAMSNRPDFGDDVGGNFAGAAHNFRWVWGSGIACTCIAVAIGLLCRALLLLWPTSSRERA